MSLKLAFPLAAFTAVVLQLFGPVTLIAVIALAMRPGRATGTWAAGAGGAAVGAALFLVAMMLKLALRTTGMTELWGDGAADTASVGESIGLGLFAGLSEEIVRFGSAAFLFRSAAVALDRDRALRPMHVALLFGLGWGGIEAAITGLTALVQTLAVLEQANGNPSEIPIPFFPLVGAFERVSAIVLHVALSAAAARAAGELAVHRAGKALAFFAAAVAFHAVADAFVHFHATPATRALAFEDYHRGVRGFLLMEVWFAVVSLSAFAWARRLRGARPSGTAVE